MTPEADRLLAYLTEHGPKRPPSLLRALEWSAETFERARQELIGEGRCSTRAGGTLCLAEASGEASPADPAPTEEGAVDFNALDRAKTEVDQAARRREREERDKEKKFYPYLVRWARGEGYDQAYEIGNLRGRSSWEHPDVLALNTSDYFWLMGTDFEITTIEAKFSITASAIWQAAHYRSFSHYVYLACYESADDIRKKEAGRLYKLAVDLGLGIISMRRAGQGGAGIACTPINSPARQAPTNREIDRFLNDYRETIRIKPPGRRIIEQQREAMGTGGR